MSDSSARLRKGDRVWGPAAAAAHHMATNHPMGGGGGDADCDVCPFAIEDGVVTHGGIVHFLAEKKP